MKKLFFFLVAILLITGCSGASSSVIDSIPLKESELPSDNNIDSRLRGNDKGEEKESIKVAPVIKKIAPVKTIPAAEPVTVQPDFTTSISTEIHPFAPTPPPVVRDEPIVKNEPKEEVQKCDPNYSGCVPIASDVDCAGGSGNGPAYVRGPVSVIGTDVYDLDRDGDGTACE